MTNIDPKLLEFGPFAETIRVQKYAQDLKDGGKETWEQTAHRVAKHVLKSVSAPKSLVDEAAYRIATRQFIPGGRYLYAAGRPFHQVQNCYAGETRVVTRVGAKPLKELSGSVATLMTTNGEWVYAPVLSFGKQPLMRVTITRAGVEKELFATPEHSWRVAKYHDKHSGRSLQKKAVSTTELRAGDYLYEVFGHGISRKSSSPAGIQHGLVYGDGNAPSTGTATIRLCGEKNKQLLQYFPLYRTRQIDSDVEVVGLPRHYKQTPLLSYDYSYLYGWLSGYFAADGCVSKEGVVTLSSTDRSSLEFVKDVCYLLGLGAYSIRTSERISNLTNNPSTIYSIALMREKLTEEFFLVEEHRKRYQENPKKRNRCSWKVVNVENTERVEEVYCAVVEDTHEFVLEDNILTGNCLLLKADDSREGWSELLQKSAMALMTGAGIGIDYSQIRAEGRPIRKTGGVATGPLALMQMVNEAGRGIMQGGSRRSAIWAGLSWKHPDIHKFIGMKNWIKEVRDLKARDFNFPATMDGTNISVQLDDEFFEAYHDDKHILHSQAQQVYWATVRQMLKTAEPGFSVDTGKNRNETLRNACTEVTSADDSDICNLGSINLARINSVEEMKAVLEVAVAFLLAGTVYSDVPYAKVDQIRTKNRRLGLGIMGIHEWLLKNGKKYGADAELEKLLTIYATSTEVAAKYADKWDLSRPVKTRAIAPNGTIGIVAETTTGIEPIFCVAYKRRYAKGSLWNYQYVVEPTAKRLIEEKGISPDAIEDAYTLAEDVERRVAFQAWVQTFVDHSISSTINLPEWGSEQNNDSKVQDFGKMLIKYLPKLRGITCYPDGARGGQPLTPVKYSTAIKHIGEVFVEATDICDLTKGGTCGS